MSKGDFSDAVRRDRKAVLEQIQQAVEIEPPEDEHGKNGELDEAALKQLKSLSKATIAGSGFLDIQIPPKELIIGDWCKEGTLGYLFATRGAGKSWLVIELCRAIALGAKCGPWAAPKARTVLYIDGEMFYEDDKERLLGLWASAGLAQQHQIPANLHILNHEVLFHFGGAALNLGRVADQGFIDRLCGDRSIKVLVLDNLSCLVSGLKENATEDWEMIQPWLLDLRRRGITIIIVHHAGKDPSRMRGGTKREDNAGWIMRLDDRKEDYSQPGAHFISVFDKARSKGALVNYEWWFEPYGDRTTVTFKEASTADLVLHWINNGLNKCTDIATELGVTKGTVSKAAKQLVGDGKLKPPAKGRRNEIYELV
jgi:hypothetical protein